MRTPLQISLTSLAATLALACNSSESEIRKLSPAKPAPTAEQSGGVELATVQPPGAPPGEVAPTVAAAQAQPSLDPNLSRNFQGELVADISLPGQQEPATLRYASHSNKLRMQLQGTPTPFDILAVNERLHVLEHDKNSYRTLDLQQIEANQEHDTIRSTISGELGKQVGLVCHKRTMHADDYRIEACVAGLPGDFEMGVFEKATGVRIPDWLATLIDEGSMPLLATAYGPDNRELFSVTVSRYSPDPVPAALFELPANYQVASE